MLSRIATFLGVAPFPRLVRNWKWEWNAHASTRGAVAASNATVGALRHFFAPYDGALAALLRRNGQPHAALYVRKWAAEPPPASAAAAAAAAVGRKRDGGEKQRARRPPRAKAAEKKQKKKAARAEAKAAEAEGGAKEEAKPGKGKEARAERKAAKAAAKAAAKFRARQRRRRRRRRRRRSEDGLLPIETRILDRILNELHVRGSCAAQYRYWAFFAAMEFRTPRS